MCITKIFGKDMVQLQFCLPSFQAATVEGARRCLSSLSTYNVFMYVQYACTVGLDIKVQSSVSILLVHYLTSE